MHKAVNTQTATVAIVPLIGEHDLSGYEPLKAALARAAIQAPNVIVDLSHCDFIDAAVIGLLLDAHSVVARDAGSFGVAMPAEPNAVTRVAELVHLSQRIPSYASVTDALANGQRNDSIVIHLKRPTAVEDVKHTIRIRDPRSRFGEPEVYVAECSCGWRGEERITGYAARPARRDGSRHLEIQGGAPTSPRPRRSRFLQFR